MMCVLLIVVFPEGFETCSTELFSLFQLYRKGLRHHSPLEYLSLEVYSKFRLQVGFLMHRFEICCSKYVIRISQDKTTKYIYELR